MVTRPPTTQEIEAYAATFRDFPKPTSAQLLGFEPVEIDVPGQRIVIDFVATDRMLNPAGKVQGGILTAMMDDTMGPLAHIMSAGKMLPSTTDIHTQFFRPCEVGRYRCEARVTRMGRTMCYTSADLFNDRGQKVASTIQTAVMLPFAPDREK
ncbi:PaaI family thioesterase [Aquisalinus flavus]|uniref:Phenylacetic acid degradation protein n=1 Tax=Aquisalinus flavus TaxID=1526572 RepID=A0A8J2V2Q3_9PROT|nr:PaaI family thioesterase [Aquisalinus flavus]MBD0426651.1 PaaI family thioesterase [Aquisalinus flavus]UNE47807.1 PaaI family thioesterase [Aquisalinus flavus]GGD06181.1 phenylacetic acid degradation protein [Aquisalinus flavus]